MNKEKFHQRLQSILRRLAIWTIQKYQPGIIAVTGSVGKTSTKEAIYAVLKKHRRVRKNSGNFNNEIGVPLTILGEWDKISFGYCKAANWAYYHYWRYSGACGIL